MSNRLKYRANHNTHVMPWFVQCVALPLRVYRMLVIDHLYISWIASQVFSSLYVHMYTTSNTANVMAKMSTYTSIWFSLSSVKSVAQRIPSALTAIPLLHFSHSGELRHMRTHVYGGGDTVVIAQRPWISIPDTW